jgi:ATP/maltotriose-dependent transcriptional regulator MalT
MLFLLGEQADTAEETAFHAITLLLANGKPVIVLHCNQVLGEMLRVKGHHEKAIELVEVTLRIASSHDWHGYGILISGHLVGVFADIGRFEI